ncbi:MAG: TolC family protein [Nannocystaceae bacterium]
MNAQLVGAQVMAFDTVVNHALANAPSVQVARSQVGLADAAIEGQKPLLPANPTVQFGLGARGNTAVSGATFELQFQAMQPLEIAGERKRRIDVARKLRGQYEKSVEQVQWEIYVQVHLAYNRALLARARALTRARLVAFSEHLLDVAQRRAQAGEISDLRVRVAEGELAQARQAALAAALNYRLACIELTEVSGFSASQTVVPAGEMQVPQAIEVNDTMLTQATTEHPAVKTYDAAIVTSQARITSADRDRWPHPQIGFAVNTESEPGSGSRSTVGMAQVGLPLPMWRRNQGKRAQARAQLRVAQSKRQALQYTLSQRIRRAADALNTAAFRVSSYSREVVPKFEANMTLLERAYALGETNLLEVLVARERFLKIQTEALDAYGKYFEAVYELERHTGQPFSQVGKPVPAPVVESPAQQ